MRELREYLRDHRLLFDGAMGTYYAQRFRRQAQHCELANLEAPDEIEAIHRAYAAAGCNAIKTNTFGANRLNYTAEDCAAIIAAAIRLAKQAAEDCWIFADIGPIDAMDEALNEEYRFVVDQFLAGGIQHFIFETHAHDRGLHEIAHYIRQKCPTAYIICSFASQADGFTYAGLSVQELLNRVECDSNIDAAGLNCVLSARHMVELLATLDTKNLTMSVQPNAGYPIVVARRTRYATDPAYFAEQMQTLASRGIKILGGCCGTEPAHIEKTAQAIQTMSEAKPIRHPAILAQAEGKASAFWDALCDPAIKPFAVELDPPETADLGKFLAGAQELAAHGANILTIADCPVARPRMDSSLLACKLRREAGIETLPHMTCRDRNLNATKALLLGLSAEGVDNALVVTGDPIPTASRDEVKSVYNFNSRLLAGYISALKQTVLPQEFRVYGALNVNALNFHVQLRLAKEKVAQGVCGFLTQPILTPQALENLKLAHQELDAKIIGGIFPVVSQKNARYLHNEVNGIAVDERVIELYAGLDRAQGEALAEKISVEIGRRIAPYVDGFYLMTPFGRTGLVCRIMEQFRKNGLC